MKINLIQIILLGICAAIAIYFTSTTINLIASGQNVVTDANGITHTMTFLDYGMIQFYVFMGVMAFLLYMLAGGSKD